MKQFEIEVKPEFDGVKPKNYLKKVLNVNYNQLIKAIKNKRISLNGKKIKEDSILRAKDIIAVWDPTIQLRRGTNREHNSSVSSLNSISNSEERKNLDMEIVYRDNDFIILNKRAGVVVQGAYDNDESLSKHLRYLEHTNPSFQKLHHVHRLDKDTTGCLLIGNGTQNIRMLNTLFQRGEVTKKYLAICIGRFEIKEDVIELSMRRNEDGKLPKVIVDEVGKKTKLHYKVSREFENKGEELSLVEIELITGFMHQIRVTMQYLGNPILGDTMYSNLRVNELFSQSVSRQLLHSNEIKFNWGGEEIAVKSQLPHDFKSLIY